MDDDTIEFASDEAMDAAGLKINELIDRLAADGLRPHDVILAFIKAAVFLTFDYWGGTDSGKAELLNGIVKNTIAQVAQSGPGGEFKH